jgi:hypothetical protein
MFEYGMVWLVLGMMVVILAVTDALWTTLTVSGAGWLSSLGSGSIGRLAMGGPRRVAENASVVSLCSSCLMWLLLLWLGWTMIFCGGPRAVVDATTSIPGTLIDRLYFAGYTITTLGLGDFKAEGAIWKVCTVLASTSGFLILTLFVTYAFSVITALNDRRTLGASVSHLGNSPEEIVLLLSDGGHQALSTRLLTLTDQLERSAMQTDAFPVLEYSCVSNDQRSFAEAVVTLGEVTLLLENAVGGEQAVAVAVWKPLRGAVNLMIGEKHSGGKNVNPRIPSPPDLIRLTQHGLSIRDNAARSYESTEVADQRRLWYGWLAWHGRNAAE